jgi:ribosomal protein S18 acetylase RimI-like enzyme
MVCIAPLDHRDPSVARQIHAVQRLAYAQEAALLRVRHFPPLDRTPEEIRSSEEFYLGALRDEAVVGALSFEPDEIPGQILISSLVVHPEHQRQGIARALVSELLRMKEQTVFVVSTGANNGPAIALYRSLGFTEYWFGTIGPDALPLVKLRRARPNPPPNPSDNVRMLEKGSA